MTKTEKQTVRATETVEVTEKDLKLLKYFIKRIKSNKEKTAMYTAFAKGLDRKLKEKKDAT